MMKHPVCQAFGCLLLLSLSGVAFAWPDNAGDPKGATGAADTTFIQKAASDGLGEISLGQLAANKSSPRSRHSRNTSSTTTPSPTMRSKRSPKAKKSVSPRTPAKTRRRKTTSSTQ
jgi:hypothetical protein